MEKPIGAFNHNPLFFFEELIQNGGIEKCYDSFLLDAEMHSGTFLSDDKIEFCFYYPKSDSPESERISERFQEKLNKELKKAFSHSILAMSSQLTNIKVHEERKGFLVHYLDILEYLYTLIDIINTHFQSELLKGWILKLISHIKEKYKSSTTDHTSFDLLPNDKDENRSAGFFQ